MIFMSLFYFQNYWIGYRMVSTNSATQEISMTRDYRIHAAETEVQFKNLGYAFLPMIGVTLFMGLVYIGVF